MGSLGTTDEGLESAEYRRCDEGKAGASGAGGVIRGEEGEWVLGFSENVGHCSVIKAKFRAVLRGLKLAKEVPIHKLWLQTDLGQLLACSIVLQVGTQSTVPSYNNADD